MADKKTELSVVISTVDKATARIKAINGRIDALTKPTRDFRKALGELGEKSGLSSVVDGFKGVGSAIAGLLEKVAMIGGVVGVAVGGLIHLVNEYEDLGKKAERLGVGVDFLAEMRDAAERSGVAVDSLDGGLQAFTSSLGQARAGTGRMLKFLNTVNPAFAHQLVTAKSSEEAFDDLADAMSKLTDPAKRAALAQKTLGDSALAPLFVRGSKGLKELRDHYLKLAGSQEGAVKAAGPVHDAMLDLKASTDGVKAALVEGLAPALRVIVDRLRDWLQGHRADIKEWAVQLGQKLPGAIQNLVEWIGNAYDKVRAFLDKIGGVKTVVVALAAVSLAPLISSVVTLVSGIGKLALAADAVGASFALWAGPIAAAVIATAALMELIDKMDAKNERALEDAAKKGLNTGKELPTDVLDTRSLMNVGDQSHAAVDTGAAGLAALMDARDSVSGQSRRALREMVASGGRDQAPGDLVASGGGPTAKITVDFANAPRGTRVRTDPQSTADVDLSVGYQMLAGSL